MKGRGHRALRIRFVRQGGLCALCAGPMELVNFQALTKKERKAQHKNPLAATLDHVIPRCEKPFATPMPWHNQRAVHLGCNGMKSHLSIEPFPLPCYQRHPARIHLGDGASIPMEIAA